jgi:N-acetylglucosamine-6-phosphate deacetylase
LAFDHGLTGFTHLFNAMSQLTAREPGAVGAALVDKGSWCSLIADGHHVDAAAMRIALRCKGLNALALVTDAMPSVGSNSPSFLLQDEQISVVDGACRNRDGRLAGAHLNMAQALWKAAELMGISLADTIPMTSANPARILGLGQHRGRIEPGLLADLVVMDSAGAVHASWIEGLRSDHNAPPPANDSAPIRNPSL